MHPPQNWICSLAIRRAITVALLCFPVICIPCCERKTTYSQVEKIVFASDRSGNWDIYILNPDGTNLKQLTTHEAPDWEASLAPDGRIAFMSRRDGSYEIFTMNIDGSDLKQLTHEPIHINGRPEWSPDGSKIVFVSNRDLPLGDGSNIYIMNRDGTEQVNLTKSPDNESDPKWSPDGSQIVFSSLVDDNRDIYIMNSDGSGRTRLTSYPACDSEPAWSPDGSSILFVSQRIQDSETRQIYVMNSDGSDVTQLTDTSESYGDSGPVWSPDGSHIVLSRGLNSCVEIILMNTDGSGEIVLVGESSQNIYPDWKLVRIPQESLDIRLLAYDGN